MPEVGVSAVVLGPLVVGAVGRGLGAVVGGHVGRHPTRGPGRGHIRGHALGLTQHPHVVRAASEGDVGGRHLHEASGHQGRSFTHLGQIIGYIMFPEK